jgi:hypothetical protein
VLLIQSKDRFGVDGGERWLRFYGQAGKLVPKRVPADLPVGSDPKAVQDFRGTALGYNDEVCWSTAKWMKADLFWCSETRLRI